MDTISQLQQQYDNVCHVRDNALLTMNNRKEQLGNAATARAAGIHIDARLESVAKSELRRNSAIFVRATRDAAALHRKIKDMSRAIEDEKFQQTFIEVSRELLDGDTYAMVRDTALARCNPATVPAEPEPVAAVVVTMKKRRAVTLGVAA